MSVAAVLDRYAPSPTSSTKDVSSGNLLSACVSFEAEPIGAFVLLFSSLAGRTEAGEPVELTQAERLSFIRYIQDIVEEFSDEHKGKMGITRAFWLERPQSDRRYPKTVTSLFRVKLGNSYSRQRVEVIELLCKVFEVHEVDMTVLDPGDLISCR